MRTDTLSLGSLSLPGKEWHAVPSGIVELISKNILWRVKLDMMNQGYYLVYFICVRNEAPLQESNINNIQIRTCFNGFPDRSAVVERLRNDRELATDLLVFEPSDWPAAELEEYVTDAVEDLLDPWDHSTTNSQHVLVPKSDLLLNELILRKLVVVWTLEDGSTPCSVDN